MTHPDAYSPAASPQHPKLLSQDPPQHLSGLQTRLRTRFARIGATETLPMNLPQKSGNLESPHNSPANLVAEPRTSAMPSRSHTEPTERDLPGTQDPAHPGAQNISGQKQAGAYPIVALVLAVLTPVLLAHPPIFALAPVAALACVLAFCQGQRR